MNLKHIEDEALHLSGKERTELAQKLLLSLDAPSENELSSIWLNEAVKRAKDFDSGAVKPIPSEAVRLKAQVLLR